MQVPVLTGSGEGLRPGQARVVLQGLTASLCLAITLQVIYAHRVLMQDELDLRLTGVLNIIEKRSLGTQNAAQWYSICLACTMGSVPKGT